MFAHLPFFVVKVKFCKVFFVTWATNNFYSKVPHKIQRVQPMVLCAAWDDTISNSWSTPLLSKLCSKNIPVFSVVSLLSVWITVLKIKCYWHISHDKHHVVLVFLTEILIPPIYNWHSNRDMWVTIWLTGVATTFTKPERASVYRSFPEELLALTKSPTRLV